MCAGVRRLVKVASHDAVRFAVRALIDRLAPP